MKVALVVIALIFYATAIVGQLLLGLGFVEFERTQEFAVFTAFSMLFMILAAGLLADDSPKKPRSNL